MEDCVLDDPVRLRGAFRIGLSYGYTLTEGSTLEDFNMEAQGDLLADYFVLKHLRRPEAMRRGPPPRSLPQTSPGRN